MKKTQTLLLLISLSLISSYSFSQVTVEKKVIIEYEKNQKIDLGSLSVNGKVVTPGDFSITLDDIEPTKLEIYKRKDYFDQVELTENLYL
jgi:hypothetical protein